MAQISCKPERVFPDCRVKEPAARWLLGTIAGCCIAIDISNECFLWIQSKFVMIFGWSWKNHSPRGGKPDEFNTFARARTACASVRAAEAEKCRPVPPRLSRGVYLARKKISPANVFDAIYRSD
ncbi:hypothetical protein [Polymorphum gilvum]|uniref:hypothetical protein n=1 Tax=Polymorphum gilvum TaxID=991904 RepID=UPI0013050F91|nr:hypothetical protein [Polymorphum gilvum]